MALDPQLAQLIRQIVKPLRDELVRSKQDVAALKKAMNDRPRTVTEEIDAIPGRRLFYSPTQSQVFTIAQLSTKGEGMIFKISQDGPYIMTHYPLAVWRVTEPSNATNFGRWRPVASYPLPTQEVGKDIIDISYEFSDGGSQRSFQDNAVPAGLLSTPDNLIPLPVPTLFTPNTPISLFPTYHGIAFNGSTPPTDGLLVIVLPGYKIANM